MGVISILQNKILVPNHYYPLKDWRLSKCYTRTHSLLLREQSLCPLRRSAC